MSPKQRIRKAVDSNIKPSDNLAQQKTEGLANSEGMPVASEPKQARESNQPATDETGQPEQVYDSNAGDSNATDSNAPDAKAKSGKEDTDPLTVIGNLKTAPTQRNILLGAARAVLARHTALAADPAINDLKNAVELVEQQQKES